MFKQLSIISIAFLFFPTLAYSQTEVPEAKPVIPILYAENDPQYQEATEAIASLKQRHPHVVIFYTGELKLLWDENLRKVRMSSDMALEIWLEGDIVSEDIDDLLTLKPTKLFLDGKIPERLFYRLSQLHSCKDLCLVMILQEEKDGKLIDRGFRNSDLRILKGMPHLEKLNIPPLEHDPKSTSSHAAAVNKETLKYLKYVPHLKELTLQKTEVESIPILSEILPDLESLKIMALVPPMDLGEYFYTYDMTHIFESLSCMYRLEHLYLENLPLLNYEEIEPLEESGIREIVLVGYGEILPAHEQSRLRDAQSTRTVKCINVVKEFGGNPPDAILNYYEKHIFPNDSRFLPEPQD